MNSASLFQAAGVPRQVFAIISILAGDPSGMRIKQWFFKRNSHADHWQRDEFASYHYLMIVYWMSRNTMLAPSAGSMTTAPTLKKLQAPIRSPSRRNAVSHRIVARAGDR
jgi:hypothetical protein